MSNVMEVDASQLLNDRSNSTLSCPIEGLSTCMPGCSEEREVGNRWTAVVDHLVCHLPRIFRSM